MWRVFTWWRRRNWSVVSSMDDHDLAIDPAFLNGKFVARCSCGWVSTSKVNPSLARLVWERHRERVSQGAKPEDQ
jgi:hypothetical protein